MVDFSRDRDRMVRLHLARRGISDPHVLEAMRCVPREAFVPKGLEEFAYDDSPLPISEGQTISQPYIVALMIEAAEIEPGERVLEIGAGSGYAAAVMSRIADRVYTIERQAVLADEARRRLADLGYDNVEVIEGDGTRGWAEAAPYDAIIVAAGGPAVPEPLRDQLRIGGRLVIPVGERQRSQRLVTLTRIGQTEFREDDLGEVRFVPLVGEHGWSEHDGRTEREARTAGSKRQAAHSGSVPELIREAAEDLPDIDAAAFGQLFDRFTEARVVLLGEASHGTSEFYRARAAITRRLIERHGFTIVAVEADWPDAAAVDRYVRHKPARPTAELAFRRFPTWMWRNIEVESFIEWLRERNGAVRNPAGQAGFFGLDMYNLNASVKTVLDYLDKVDPEAARVARERYGCLTPWQSEPSTYGRAALSAGYAPCENAVLGILRDLLEKHLQYAAADGESFLDAAQNARLVASAERYYRVMYYGSAESWNLRDRHMFETLEQLLAWRGEHGKAVVWAHNSHIGNAAATEMGVVRDELNIGQLCRERFGTAAALIGFGTDRGTVAAASDWDGPVEIKQVRPSYPGSYERLCRDGGVGRLLLDLRKGQHDALRHELLAPRLERFIGVIYRPETELESHYSEASLPQQFDAYVWFEESNAVTPLPTKRREGMPETYPFGL
ncbi:MAG: protein-L-isoaspartate(D-aspartate) O-methyltransferase [Alphaproteobacteria bacterium]|nr:MAG: protein-L-isoaspartate(D-aspartate) O-methyltransferase [Alphaproteobacteria bacterium]